MSVDTRNKHHTHAHRVEEGAEFLQLDHPRDRAVPICEPARQLAELDHEGRVRREAVDEERVGMVHHADHVRGAQLIEAEVDLL